MTARAAPFHLANLYQIENRTLKQAVRRNLDRFPDDFMFELNDEEINQMVSQSVIPSKSYFGGGTPLVFTEQGVAMLSSVLKSPRAIKINIEIMRTFARYRALLRDNEDLRKEMKQLDEKIDDSFRYLLNRIDDLHQTNEERALIGFRRNEN